MSGLLVKPYSILFVCTGNICRSPTAEGVMLKKLRERGWTDAVLIDSAGTHGYHEESPPDERAQRHAAKRGYDLSKLRARRVLKEDFARFDAIVAMDHDNLGFLTAMCPPEQRDKLELMMRHAPQHQIDIVPDPYYGGPAGFDQVLDYIEDACEGLIAALAPRLAR
jgi:protein-tyrosine phosphatase